MTSVAIRNYFFGRHQASNVAEISISKLHLFNRYQYNTAIWKCHISTILRSEFDLWWCQIKGDLERIKLEIFSLEQLQTRVAECTLIAPSPIKINVSFIWTFLLCNPNKNQILTRRAQVSDQIILRSLTWASIALCNLCCEVDGIDAVPSARATGCSGTLKSSEIAPTATHGDRVRLTYCLGLVAEQRIWCP